MGGGGVIQPLETRYSTLTNVTYQLHTNYTTIQAYDEILKYSVHKTIIKDN